MNLNRLSRSVSLGFIRSSSPSEYIQWYSEAVGTVGLVSRAQQLCQGFVAVRRLRPGFIASSACKLSLRDPRIRRLAFSFCASTWLLVPSLFLALNPLLCILFLLLHLHCCNCSRQICVSIVILLSLLFPILTLKPIHPLVYSFFFDPLPITQRAIYSGH